MAQRYAKQYRTMLDFFTGIMQMKNSVAEESAAVLLGSQSESIQELCQCMQQFEKNTQQSQHAVGQWIKRNEDKMLRKNRRKLSAVFCYGKQGHYLTKLENISEKNTA